jgi:hypothetical protein
MGVSIPPVHVVHEYTESIYKVITFKGVRDPDSVFLRHKEDMQHYDTKLDTAFSRARSMVLQYALCNKWDFFFTGTLDDAKYSRSDLDRFMISLSQWVRDMRKAYQRRFDVLLVPEQHQDGSWHVHGLIAGLPSNAYGRFIRLDLREVGLGWLFPLKLVDGDFYNWYDFAEKFGYCSLAPVRDPVATAFYITKYVSKDLTRRADDLGKHLYFHSRPLKHASKASDVYLFNSELSDLCDHDYDFCKTGMVEGEKWYFPYCWDGAEPVDAQPLVKPLAVDPAFNPASVDPEYIQERLY